MGSWVFGLAFVLLIISIMGAIGFLYSIKALKKEGNQKGSRMSRIKYIIIAIVCLLLFLFPFINGYLNYIANNK